MPFVDKIKAIDALLPQTQCGLCTYNGCKPYATAIVEKNERIDLCLPGGTRTLNQLGQLCSVDTKPLEAGMREKQKPPMLAKIREHECIGCTKCIQACPVDAIVGSAKLMHTVITDACNGCELCVPPCPVDCIDMLELPEKSEQEIAALQLQSRARFEKRNARAERETHAQEKQEGNQKKTIDDRRSAIEEILKRSTRASSKYSANS